MPNASGTLRRFRFDQLATQVNDRVDDPAASGVERYVGLEHLDADSLSIRRWGEITDVESTKLRFQPGDIIFGKRRVYQRKLAVADFEGICSAHAMVLRAKPDVVDPGFLPYFMQSDLFMERALSISVGSLSPTINWKDLAQQEFALPPIEEQRAVVKALQAIDQVHVLHRAACASAELVLACCRDREFKPVSIEGASSTGGTRLGDLVQWTRGLTYDGNQASSTPCEGAVECIGIPCIRSDGTLDLSGVVYVSHVDIEQVRQRQVVDGATLLIGSNGNPRRIGNCVFVPRGEGRVFGGFLLQATPSTNEIIPEYLYHLLASSAVQQAVAQEARGSTGLRNLNVKHLAAMRFAVPCRSAQQQLCDRMGAIARAVRLCEEQIRTIEAVKRELLLEGIR